MSGRFRELIEWDCNSCCLLFLVRLVVIFINIFIVISSISMFIIFRCCFGLFKYTCFLVFVIIYRDVFIGVFRRSFYF